MEGLIKIETVHDDMCKHHRQKFTHIVALHASKFEPMLSCTQKVLTCAATLRTTTRGAYPVRSWYFHVTSSMCPLGVHEQLRNSRKVKIMRNRYVRRILQWHEKNVKL